MWVISRCGTDAVGKRDVVLSPGERPALGPPSSAAYEDSDSPARRDLLVLENVASDPRAGGGRYRIGVAPRWVRRGRGAWSDGDGSCASISVFSEAITGAPVARTVSTHAEKAVRRWTAALVLAVVAALLAPTSAARADHQVVPANLVARAGYEAVYLDWDPQPDTGRDGVVRYRVHMRTGADDFAPVVSAEYSKAPVYGLKNDVTYDFKVEAVHGDSSSMSEVVTATPTQEAASSWQPCVDEADTRCIVSHSVTGEPTATIEPSVSDDVVIQWQWWVRAAEGSELQDSYDLVADGGLTTEDSLTLVLDLGHEAVGMLTSTGGVRSLSFDTDGAGHRQVTIVASPARSSWRENDCFIDACGDRETRATVDYAGKLIGSMVFRDPEELDALAGSWIATNAQSFSEPLYDEHAGTFMFQIAAPHLTFEGNPNEGFFRAFLVDAALREYWGIEDSSSLGDGDVRVRRSDGDESVEVSPTVTPVNGGVEIELIDFTYSSPAFSIAMGDTPPASEPGDGPSEPDSPAPPGQDDEPAPPTAEPPARQGPTTETSRTTPAGERTSTDTENDGATPEDPVEAGVTLPSGGAGGDVTIRARRATEDASEGYSFLDLQVDITAPAQTAHDPLRLDFQIDATAIPEGHDVTSLQVFRNGSRVPACSSAAVADPDPCVTGRDAEGDDAVVTVLTSRASRWSFAIATSACPSGAVPGSGFSDVEGNAHAAAIDCMAWWQVTRGVDESTYDVNGTVSRAQAAAFVTRALEAAGVNLPADPRDRFGDDDGTVHELAINQLASLGVVDGRTSSEFWPDRAVTRGQLAALVVAAFEAAAGEPLAPGPDAFADDDGTVHEAAINEAAHAGFVRGKRDTSFGPHLPVRRDEMASVLVRMLDELTEQGRASPPAA